MVASSTLTEGTAPCPGKTPYPLLIIGLTQEVIKIPTWRLKKLLTGVLCMNTNEQGPEFQCLLKLSRLLRT